MVAESNLALGRRKLLAAAGIGSGALVAASVAAPAAAEAASVLTPKDGALTPPVAGLHLQFGQDAASEVVVSWHTLQQVANPRVIVGTLEGQMLQVQAAHEVSYTDAKSGQVVYAYHAPIRHLEPGSDHLYAAYHDGAAPEFGTFTTGPRGRARFTFTSFADQGTPTLGKTYVPPAGVTLPGTLFVNDNLGSPAAGDTTLGVEQVEPLFHIFSGDFCYANLSTNRVRSWWDFWANNSRSARNRPWMPCPGNHENELGNGPIGYGAYQTFFSVPRAGGQTAVTRGLWYAYTVGSVRVISLANDDVCYQDAGNSYVRGYSGGEQKAWLEQELALSRVNPEIDWIVVSMHQVAISTVNMFNGADLGIREEWLPLFDRYGVDLVVTGHEHHYERTHPIRGQQANQTLTPIPQAFDTNVIDTTKGTVHMIIGGGGTSAPSNTLFFNPPQCRVIVAVGAPNATTGVHPPIYVTEDAPWSAVRNPAEAYGFAKFVVDPGTEPGGLTTMTVTYYNVLGLGGQLSEFETFTLQRPRRD